MNIFSVILGGLVLAAAIAGLTNPRDEEFNAWMRERVAEHSAIAATAMSNPDVTRTSYILASAFDVRLLDADVARCYGAFHAVFVCTPRVGASNIPGLRDVFS